LPSGRPEIAVGGRRGRDLRQAPWHSQREARHQTREGRLRCRRCPCKLKGAFGAVVDGRPRIRQPIIEWFEARGVLTALPKIEANPVQERRTKTIARLEEQKLLFSNSNYTRTVRTSVKRAWSDCGPPSHSASERKREPKCSASDSDRMSPHPCEPWTRFHCLAQDPRSTHCGRRIEAEKSRLMVPQG
jgi:hypothetical protein